MELQGVAQEVDKDLANPCRVANATVVEIAINIQFQRQALVFGLCGEQPDQVFRKALQPKWHFFQL